MTSAMNRGLPRTGARMLVAAVWLAAVVFPGMASGSNLGFLKDAPITRFTGTDLELFQSNLTAALEQNADGDTRHWENPNTGSSGQITVVNNVAHDGKRCRRTRISNRARGHAETQTDVVFCKEADGRWVLSEPKRSPAGGTDK